MSTFTDLDFAIDDNGNLSTRNGDIARHGSLDSMAKTIEWRLKTSRQEWRGVNPFIVAGLDEFRGHRNTKETGESMKVRIENALSADLFIHPTRLQVDVVPINAEEVRVFIKINRFRALDIDGSVDIEYSYQFNFNEGDIISLTGGTR